MQIIVYAGAIVVLFLFVIMLLGVDQHESLHDPVRLQRPAAIVLGVIGLAEVLFLAGHHWATGASPPARASTPGPAATSSGSPAASSPTSSGRSRSPRSCSSSRSSAASCSPAAAACRPRRVELRRDDDDDDVARGDDADDSDEVTTP